MNIVLDVFLWLSAAALLVPLVVLVVETWAALLPGWRANQVGPAGRPRCVVLVPAHNEETGIGRTILAILPQLGADDRLVVVADNCTDRTADVVRSLGATVLERTDPAPRQRLRPGPRGPLAGTSAPRGGCRG